MQRGNKKYVARAMTNRRNLYIGQFDTVYEAELARMDHERDNWGIHTMPTERVIRHEALQSLAACIDEVTTT